jgi:hypothetical protein
MDWSITGSISGATNNSPHFKLNGTIGQMAASTQSVSVKYQLCSGQQCGNFPFSLHRVYLPIVFKD